jgi:acetyl-CoA decarbonylase/synthase, CODH/ACS complex subunit gamma
MALTGIQIYKLLPKTNCKECGFPTCLAFAMKLAAKQVELADCPYVTEEATAELAESAAPPIRLITLTANGHKVEVGNEVVLFRHEKTFYHRPGIFVRLRDDLTHDELRKQVAFAGAYSVNYVGRDLKLDGFAIEATGAGPEVFAGAVAAAQSDEKYPLILMSRDPDTLAAGLAAGAGESPLLYAADESNWEAIAALAKEHKASLAVTAPTLEGLAELTEKIQAAGVEDLVLDPAMRDFSSWLGASTQIRRLALKKNFRPLGYPVIAFTGGNNPEEGDPGHEVAMAAQTISKYAGLVVLDRFAPDLVYPLLVLRENLYTDPQKPIQVQPGLYEINNPKPGDPLLVTTNFSITYFSVANEVEGAGLPAWLLVADAEGMSVLTAWAAGNFDAERVAKDVNRFGIPDKIDHRSIVIPGHVAVISGELEEELPGWDVRVGPREAVDLPAFMKNVLAQ